MSRGRREYKIVTQRKVCIVLFVHRKKEFHTQKNSFEDFIMEMIITQRALVGR